MPCPHAKQEGTLHPQHVVWQQISMASTLRMHPDKTKLALFQQHVHRSSQRLTSTAVCLRPCFHASCRVFGVPTSGRLCPCAVFMLLFCISTMYTITATTPQHCCKLLCACLLLGKSCMSRSCLSGFRFNNNNSAVHHRPCCSRLRSSACKPRRPIWRDRSSGHAWQCMQVCKWHCLFRTASWRGGAVHQQQTNKGSCTCSSCEMCCRNSQGFCCECSLAATYSSTIGSGSTTTSRANLNCNLFSGGLFLEGVPGSAHCLRFSSLYYAVRLLSSYCLKCSTFTL